MAPKAVEMSEAMNNESCNTWTEVGVLSPTVSAVRLGVPGKASGEYQKGCSAFRDKRYHDAEVHLHKALEDYPAYVSAWVVLGQVMDAQDKRGEARDACARASNIDPTYVPPYLCLADLAATQNDWEQVSTMADHALALDPNRNPYALYYKADADVHLEKFPEAEKNGLAAVRIDKAHRLPQLHTLLAQVYKALGDVPAQIAQLREYLKVSPNAPDANGVKSVLAQLDSKPANP